MTDDDTAPEAATDQEALRLVVAFYCIMEPEKREALLALAERYAIDSKAKVASFSDAGHDIPPVGC
jgi:hypothetical protein